MEQQPPPRSDPEIAGAVFGADLAAALATNTAQKSGWKLTPIDPLAVVIEMTAKREGVEDENYFVKLEADWYDQYPPKVTFVEPGSGDGWTEAGGTSRWLPLMDNTDPGFAIHHEYGFPNGEKGQLVCSSINMQYYWTHSVETGKAWQQGKTTVMWTLSVIQDALTNSHYKGSHNAADQ